MGESIRRIRDLMKEAVCVSEDDPLQEALAIMVTNDFSQLLVTGNNGGMVGSLRENRIAEMLAQNCGDLPDLSSSPVSLWMSDRFQQHSCDELICDIAAILHDEPAITVTDRNGNAGFILTRADLVRDLLERVPGIPGHPETWSYKQVLEEARKGESEVLELKREAKASDVVEEAAALANTRGGVVVIGIPDEYPSNGDLGPDLNLKKAEEQISNGIADLVDPAFGSLARIIPKPDRPGSSTGVLLLAVAKSHRLHTVNGTYFYRQGTTSRRMSEQMVRARYRRLLGG